MRRGAVIVAVMGGVAGAALLWLGIATSTQPNEGTPEGPYDLVIAALAVWAITAMVVPACMRTADDPAFPMIGLAPFVPLAGAFVCARILTRAPKASSSVA